MELGDKLELAIAYHEAAHAVFAQNLSIDILKVSIKPDDEFAGGCEVDLVSYFYKNITNMRNATVELIKFHLAGKIAHRKYLVENDIDPDSVLKNAGLYDDQKVAEYVHINNSNGYECIDLAEICSATTDIVFAPKDWLKIQKLADILFHTKELASIPLD